MQEPQGRSGPRAGRQVSKRKVKLLLIAAACGGDGDGLTIERAWARSSPRMTSAGAVYMEVTSDVTDVLVGASVEPSIAARVEIHETAIMEGGDGEGGMDGGMTMMEIGEISLVGSL